MHFHTGLGTFPRSDDKVMDDNEKHRGRVPSVFDVSRVSTSEVGVCLIFSMSSTTCSSVSSENSQIASSLWVVAFVSCF